MATQNYTWNCRKFLRNMLILAIIIAIIYYAVTALIKERVDYTTLNYINQALESEHQALIMRDEKKVISQLSGSFQPLVADGDLVKINQKIGDFEVKELAEESEKKEVNKEQSLLKEEEVKAEVDALFASLVTELKTKQYIKAKITKRELEMKLSRLQMIADSNSENAYARLNNQISIGDDKMAVGDNIEIYSTNSGIITYFLDGYEDLLNYENRYKIDYQKIFTSPIEAKDSLQADISGGQAFFKIISIFEWYLVCQIETDNISDYVVGEQLEVTLLGKTLQADISDVFEAGNKGILVVKVRSAHSDFYKQRKVDVKIRLAEAKGIKIYDNCLVKSKGEQGVYAVDANQQIYFIPIKVLAEVDDGVIVKEGSFNITNEDGEIQSISTVKQGDRVVVNAVKYSEGQKVD